jgi:subtilisin family serine protease
MRRDARLAFALLATLLSAQAGMSGSPPQQPTPPPDPAPSPVHAAYVEHELLVRFRPGVSEPDKADAHRGLGAAAIETYDAVENLDRVRLPSGMEVADAMAWYKAQRTVEYAEPNYVLQAAALPNDTRVAELWGLNNTGQTGGTADADIDAFEAWDLTTGSDDVVVAVIDTGIDYTHPDLAANMFRNTADCNANGLDDDANGYVDDCHGIDTANDDSDPMDDNRHGTHCAGTIGARGDNAAGVAGVNWRVKLMACKFLDANGSGATSDAIACLSYVKAMKERGVNVVATSNSWGGSAFSQALLDAIEAQRTRDILFIAAAGNAASNNDATPAYPAGLDAPNVIAVGATTKFDARSSFSNYGRSTVHLAAPGSEILSTVPAGGYQVLSGTSMATPHVAGVAALLEAHDPSRDWRAIKNLLLAGGDLVAGAADTISGRRLNAYTSLTCSDRRVSRLLRPSASTSDVSVGSTIDLRVLNINCGVGAGAVTATVSPGGAIVTLLDNGSGGDQAAGDGVYSARWTVPAANRYTLTFSNGESVVISPPRPYGAPAPVPYDYRAIAGANLQFGDDSSAALTPPFPVRFGGNTYSTVHVAANGHINFSRSLAFYYFNAHLPTSVAPTFIAPWFDDLYPIPFTNQNVFWAVQGEAPRRELVIEWRDVRHYECPGPTGGSVRFQVVLFEDRDDVVFNYADTEFGGSCAFADGGHSATVGVQAGLTTAYEYAYNGTSAAGSVSLLSGTSLLWTVDAPAPASFGKLAPADGAANQPPATILSWEAHPDATSYQYCVDTSNNSTCDAAWISAGGATTAALGGLQSGTTYYWSVRAIAASASTEADGGAWWAFTTAAYRPAQLLYPSPGVPLPGASATFAWDRGLNVVQYSLWIGNSPGGGEYYKANESGLFRTVNGLPLDGRVIHVRLWSRIGSTWTYADTAFASATSAGSFDASIVPVPGDFDGDDRHDIATWVGGPGRWYVRQSATGDASWTDVQWGRLDLGDVPVPGDYDGDGKTDPAVWRRSTGFWYILRSSTNYATWTAIQWGREDHGDRPVPGDYDGDGKTDPAVWRSSDGGWYALRSATGYSGYIGVVLGAPQPGDVPVPADYDGDDKVDPAVYRPLTGHWTLARSASGYATTLVQWGSFNLGDVPVPGDYDGDGKADPAVWRTSDGNWYALRSSTGYGGYLGFALAVAEAGDRAIPADYDGDGKTDPAIWRARDSAWLALKSGTGYSLWIR